MGQKEEQSDRLGELGPPNIPPNYPCLLDKKRKMEKRDETNSDRDVSTTKNKLASSQSSPNPTLMTKMMREQRNRDPFTFYEVVEVLGIGSMGTVSRVRKKDAAVGGSARKENSSRGSKERNPFYGIPIAGCLFATCTGHSERSITVSSSVGDSDRSQPSCFGGSKNPFCSFIQKHFGRKDIISQSDYARQKRLDLYHVVTESGTFQNVVSPKYEAFYALKSIHLNRVSEKTSILELENEIEILKTLDHPHIVRPIETFEHSRQLFMVMELCSGGDLYTRDPYTEEQAARIVHSILSALAYMHSKNIIHRDLKYENIMFANASPKADIKIIDFGLSKKYGNKDDVMSDGVGTIYTMAPQVFEGEYTSQADIWSVGVLAYMLLSSQMPFYGKKRRHVIKKIMRCDYDFVGKRWNAISTQGKEFVSNLIQIDPYERPTAEESMQYLWLNKRFAASLRAPEGHVLDNIQATLKNFSNYKKLKKLALMVIAHKSTSEEIGILRKVFTKYDKAKDGCISFDEFCSGLAEYGYPDDEIDDMFRGVDIDGTGKIRYTEFLAATIEAHGTISEERLAEAFDRLDSDDSGYISLANLREILGKEVSKSEIQSIIEECDLTNDNKISYEEFLALWDQHQEEQRQEYLRQLTSQKSKFSQNGDSSSSGSSNHIFNSIESEEQLFFQHNRGQSLCSARSQFKEEKQLSESNVASLGGKPVE